MSAITSKSTQENMQSAPLLEHAVYKRQPLPWYYGTAMGFAMGMVEVTVNHPIWALKTRQQAKYPFTLNPRILYQGFGAHAASSVPIDALQVTVSRVVQEKLLPDGLPFAVERLTSGFLGGCAAGLIACPSEMIMTRQQLGFTFDQAARQIYQEGKIRRLFTAVVPTLMRDGMFCAGFFGRVPLIKRTLFKSGNNEFTASTVSGIAAGALTAMVSQPWDTVKTHIQASPKGITVLQGFAQLYTKNGMPGLFDGLQLRMTRVALSILILGTMHEQLEKTFLKPPIQEGLI